MALILDVLVIGSGALGCATAFYLTEAGVRRVGVVDRGPLVSGMTRRNAGLVHTHHPSAAITKLALSSLDTFRHWSALVGGSCGFVETGLVVTVETQDGARRLRERVDSQHRLGIDCRIIEEDERATVFPRVSFEGVTAAAYEPASGYVDPVLASQAYARRAREKGANFVTGTLVKEIVSQRAHVAQVVTTTGIIQTPIVIVTAGAGAERLLAPLGLSLDLRGMRGAIGFFEQPASLYDGHPAILDYESSSFLRPHAFHLSTAGITTHATTPKATEPLDDVVDTSETLALSQIAARRLPLLAQAPLKRSHSILYDIMPDGHPVLGAIPGSAGLFIAAGFGEDAVSITPAVGRILADLVVDGHAGVDLQEFRLTRQTITHTTEPD